MINVSTLTDAKTAFTNSGLLEAVEFGDDTTVVARHIRANASADWISTDELNSILEAYVA
jgi:hypothetical protein